MLTRTNKICRSQNYRVCGICPTTLTPHSETNTFCKIYVLVTMVYSYNYYNSGHYPSSCLLFKTQLNSIGLSVPHRKSITSPLLAQQVNAIYRFVTMVYEYNYHNSGYYPSSCLLFKTQLNSIGLSVPHREHITSPLRAQQVNAIYRFVTTVY
jgi:hypothetical protein